MLGPDATVWERRFGVLPGGNAPFDPHGDFAGHNLFYTARTIADIAQETGLQPAAVGEALARGRQRLFEARAGRPRPARDDKVLASWNGLMIAACARAARVLGVPAALGEGVPATGAQHLAAAQRCAGFIRARMWNDTTGRLQRRHAAGASGIDAFAEDYAYLAWGLLELFQADGDPAWLDWARRLHETLDRGFAAGDDAGWFATTGEDPSVLLRQLEEYDGAEPAATSVAVINLLVLARLTGDGSYQVRAEAVLRAWGVRLRRQPRVAPFMLAALATSLLPAAEVAIVEADDAAAARSLRHAVDARFLPSTVLVPVVPDHARALVDAVPWVEPLLGQYGAPAAYFCRDFVCEQPTSDPAVLAAALDRLVPPPVVEPIE